MALSLQSTYLAQCLLKNTELMMRKVKETEGGTIYRFAALGDSLAKR